MVGGRRGTRPRSHTDHGRQTHRRAARDPQRPAGGHDFGARLRPESHSARAVIRRDTGLAASPIVLLSGCVGFGEEYTRVEGFSKPRRRRHRAEGHDGQPAPRQSAAPRLRNADGHAECHRPAEPGRRGTWCGILPTLDFSETRFIANVCGSTIEEYVEVCAASTTRRSTRSRSTSPARTSRKAACVRQLPGHVGPRGRGLPRGDEEAHHHQAVAEPDRHPENARRCIEAGSRRAGGDQHPHGHGDRRRGAPPGDRQRAGRPVGARHQADRAAEGAGRSTRSRSRTASRSSARAASPRPPMRSSS
jgi:hypothetical protein